jgi:mRNA-degrading endonuclease RelE of RelBE toxin-antitoxin system
MSTSESAVIVSNRARIALDTLHPADQKRVRKVISLLGKPVGELLSRGQAYKLAMPGQFYVVRATHKVRIIFEITDEQIEIVDIVPADRLRRIFQTTN